MSVLQPVLDFIHLLRNLCYYILLISYHVGHAIFLFLSKLCDIVEDFFVALAIVGEELYHFLCELEDGLSDVGIYLQTSTSSGIHCVLNALGLFCQHISHFFTGTKIYSRLLATHIGQGIGNLFALVHRALLLIADCVWWLLTIVPRALLSLLITLADAFVFMTSSIAKLVVRTANTLIDDVFRLTISIVVLFLLIRHRRRCAAVILSCAIKTKQLLRRILVKVYVAWTRLLHSLRLTQITANASPADHNAILRRSPLPSHHGRSPSRNDKSLESQRCVVCRDNIKCVLLLPCRHLCLCEECADHMAYVSFVQHCPLCRGQVTQSMSVYT